MAPRTRTLAQLLFKIFVRPIFPFLQKGIQSFGLFTRAVTVEGPYQRQPYLIRHVTQGETIEDILSKLRHADFHSEPLALQEHGQRASLRKLCDEVQGHQYHIRIFTDGEIRGHYELTPEDHPIGHWKEKVFENRKEKFLTWLK